MAMPPSESGLVIVVNHGGRGSSEFEVGDANANCPSDFQKYLSEFKKRAILSEKNYGNGPRPDPPQIFSPVDHASRLLIRVKE